MTPPAPAPPSTPLTLPPLAAVKRAHLASRALLDRALSTTGISLAQFSVLRLLSLEPGMSGAELARSSSVTAPTMNEIVATLERNGLITRTPAAGGRALLASLTPAGRAALRRCQPVLDQVQAALLDHLDPRQLAITLTVLDRIAEAADALDGSTFS